MNNFLLTQSQTAEAFNISVMAFNKWNMTPEKKEGRYVYYDIRKVIKHRLARDNGKEKDTLASERTRLTRNQADKAELEVALLRGELIPVGVIEDHWESMVVSMRAKLLNLPSRAATAALDATSLKDIEDAIKILTYEALDEIAHSGIPEKTEPMQKERIPGSGVTTKSNSKPMGRQQSKTEPRSKL
jgi:phage terminase Nu1 subunit (DNA packaging protein)